MMAKALATRGEGILDSWGESCATSYARGEWMAEYDFIAGIAASTAALGVDLFRYLGSE